MVLGTTVEETLKVSVKRKDCRGSKTSVLLGRKSVGVMGMNISIRTKKVSVRVTGNSY